MQTFVCLSVCLLLVLSNSVVFLSKAMYQNISSYIKYTELIESARFCLAKPKLLFVYVSIFVSVCRSVSVFVCLPESRW